MKKFLLPLFLLCCVGIKADECEEKCDEKDNIKFALTIERPENVSLEIWSELEKKVNECIKECEESEKNSPTFLEDAKKQIARIITAIEQLPSFYAVFHLSVNPKIQENFDN